MFEDLNFEDLNKNKPFVLYYANEDLNEDIEQYDIIGGKNLVSFIRDRIASKEKENIVWCFSFDSHVFVHCDWSVIVQLLEKMLDYFCESNLFFYEFCSYEEAYEFALDLQEPKKLCYKREDEGSATTDK